MKPPKNYHRYYPNWLTTIVMFLFALAFYVALGRTLWWLHDLWRSKP